MHYNTNLKNIKMNKDSFVHFLVVKIDYERYLMPLKKSTNHLLKFGLKIFDSRKKATILK